MAPNLIKAALAVLVLGSAPHFLYALYGPVDSDPIGLGLMASLAVPLSLTLAAASGIIYLRQSRRSGQTV